LELSISSLGQPLSNPLAQNPAVNYYKDLRHADRFGRALTSKKSPTRVCTAGSRRANPPLCCGQALSTPRWSCTRARLRFLERASGEGETWGKTTLGGLTAAALLGLALCLA